MLGDKARGRGDGGGDPLPPRRAPRACTAGDTGCMPHLLLCGTEQRPQPGPPEPLISPHWDGKNKPGSTHGPSMRQEPGVFKAHVSRVNLLSAFPCRVSQEREGGARAHGLSDTRKHRRSGAVHRVLGVCVQATLAMSLPHHRNVSIRHRVSNSRLQRALPMAVMCELIVSLQKESQDEKSLTQKLPLELMNSGCQQVKYGHVSSLADFWAPLPRSLHTLTSTPDLDS